MIRILAILASLFRHLCHLLSLTSWIETTLPLKHVDVPLSKTHNLCASVTCHSDIQVPKLVNNG